ncbi:hypothetical protein PseudUWO311_07240 [Pseudanabaena sp. UWO311]|uniref:hypothetical protein n=1 Tax=Pseudanabaena sp. UWO311 TaxID=2487337 RepID=UPI001156CD90|nr:hypothetical protein [Pseudanabaena sp. UWO311]TYQ27808.1 hypothetical protein PseudUWO311_07240 [Pseudanabaena sp. UWO311]
MFWTADRIYSQGIEQAQQRIYEFFLEIVRRKSPDEVLADFKNLFVNFSESHNPEITEALDQILTAYNEKEFFYTLRRCCYILINNWTVSNNRVSIQSLIDIFSHPSIHKKPKSIKLRTIRIWLQMFIQSEDFQSLQLFALHLDDHHKQDQKWGNRFASYLLAYQYTNPASPLEQRQAANLLAQKLKNKFKFDLAMYTARVGNHSSLQNQQTNPTSLSNNVINLVTLMLTKKSVLNCQKLAINFLENTKDSSYQEFKISLLKYLDFSVTDVEISETVQTKLQDGLLEFKSNHDDYPVNISLILKATKYLISEITISDRDQPTELFNILLHHTNPINLVVLLLKILLISESIRPYLELRVAAIIKYYSQYSETKCKSVIAFIDMLNIALAIYAGETRYNIVKMNPYELSNSQENDSQSDSNISASDSNISAFDTRKYRIFSQAR